MDKIVAFIIILSALVGILFWLNSMYTTYVATFSAIIAALVASIIALIAKIVTPDNTKKERHTQNIITVFQKLKFLKIVVENDGRLALKILKNVNALIGIEEKYQRPIFGSVLLTKPDAYFPLDALEYWDQAEAHLKDNHYQNIWNSLSWVVSKVEEYNATNPKSEEARGVVYEQTNQKLRGFSIELNKLIIELKGGAELNGKCKLGY